MTDEMPASPAPSDGQTPATPSENLVGGAIVVGCLSAAIGVVVGLVAAFERIEAACPDGTYFPLDETDLRCFEYPNAYEGTAIVLISLMLGILIVLTGVLAKAAVRDKERDDQQ